MTEEELKEYFRLALYAEAERYLEEKYNGDSPYGDWRWGWANVELRDDWDKTNTERYELQLELYDYLTEEAAIQAIAAAYRDVEIIRINEEFDEQQVKYYDVIISIGPNSPYFEAGNDGFAGNIITIIVDGLEQEYWIRNEVYTEERGFRILALRRRRSTGTILGNGDWILTVELLPNNAEFEPKWRVRYPRRFPFDRFLPPDVPNPDVGSQDGGWSVFNYDEDLDNFLKANVISLDVKIFLSFLSKAMARQMIDFFDKSKYTLLPLYIDDFTNTEQWKLWKYNKKTQEPLEIPIVMGDFQYLGQNLSEFLRGGLGESWLDEAVDYSYRGRADRFDIVKQLIDRFNEYRGIFAGGPDPNDYYGDNRESVYPFSPPHKFTKMVHSIGERFASPLYTDPGNTHEVIRFPTDEIAEVLVEAVDASETLVNRSLKEPKNFVISDTFKSRSKNDINTEFTSENWSQRDDITNFRRDLYLYADDNLAVNVTFWQTGNFYTGRDDEWGGALVGESFSLFEDLNITNIEQNCKKIIINNRDLVLTNTNIALTQGDSLLRIFDHDTQNGILYVEDPNDILAEGPATVTYYWTASIPGEPLEDIWTNSNIIIRNYSQNYFDGVPYVVDKATETRSNRTNYGWNDSNTADMANICQNVLHAFIDDFSLDMDINITGGTVISQFDDDWGVPDTELVLNRAELASVALARAATGADAPAWGLVVREQRATLISPIPAGVKVGYDGGYPYSINYIFTIDGGDVVND